MRKVSAAVFALLASSGFVHAADMPAYPPPVVVWSWTGLYLGGHLGAGFGSSSFSDPAGPAIFGGTVRTSAAVGGGQIGYNWRVPNSPVVLGVETDAELMSSDGSSTCLASSGYFISANCRVRPIAGGSFTGRLGFATGKAGRTLVYAKGGLAWLDETTDITTNATLPYAPSSLDGVRWGWTVGAGVERALTPAWSLRLEYDYAKFADVGMATPASYFQVAPPSASGFVTNAGGTTNVGQSLQTVKLGLNYKIGEDLHAQWQPSASDYHLRGTADTPVVPEAEIEIGGRVWYSSGRFQKDLATSQSSTLTGLLVSRLTYDTSAATGELFARIDSAANIFVKGFIGGGKLLSGNMHDEDWLLGDAVTAIPYSNTQSSVAGDLAYGTFDVGYSVFRGPSANVGGFVGFNYYQEDKSAYGCSQIANPYLVCVPAIPSSTLGITESDKWYSLRVGLNGVVTLADRWKLTADAAYLPYVAFRGTDNHLLRADAANTVSPENGSGQGVQLEALLSYVVSNAFSVGAGGRYWAMWAPTGYTNIFSTPCPCQGLPVRTERYGAFLQASYKIDGLK
jgi:opacity protein-like surface antigen/outer membrane protease